MEKLPEIATIISALSEKYDLENVRLSTSWDSKADSIGMISTRNNGRLAYICWYPQGYFMSLELLAPPDDTRPYIAGGEHNNLSLEHTIEIVSEHLGFRST